MSSIASTRGPVHSGHAAGLGSLPPEYAIPEQAPSLAEAQAYCQRLARSHYENFSVATWFLPQQSAAALLQSCMPTAASPTIWETRLATPQRGICSCWMQWEAELRRLLCAAIPRHPVFIALARRSGLRYSAAGVCRSADGLPSGPDGQRYRDLRRLLGYCRYSANPVGHLVLYLCGYRDAERQALSDYTCTALQLANFWQDVSVD